MVAVGGGEEGDSFENRKQHVKTGYVFFLGISLSLSIYVCIYVCICVRMKSKK